jgi:hypothetical protein
LTKYHLELDPHLEALVGRFVQSFSPTHWFLHAAIHSWTKA